ncbi:hypothetical protein C8J55DRAFT_487612 [Lentinula edodes]|uniref:Uncharacterized protein n=1 Tax=Lentinula lateritia TaxID=40482 RepID=A0A9W9DVR7_9AGAR|nr:hypothetical protein C8J55DRAFT_487612 [Lentinula edodes]
MDTFNTLEILALASAAANLDSLPLDIPNEPLPIDEEHDTGGLSLSDLVFTDGEAAVSNRPLSFTFFELLPRIHCVSHWVNRVQYLGYPSPLTAFACGESLVDSRFTCQLKSLHNFLSLAFCIAGTIWYPFSSIFGK